MEITPLHREAQANLDAKAAALAGRVVLRPPLTRPSRPDWLNVETKSIEPISPILIERPDVSGGTGEISWSGPNGDLGLFGDAYVEFIRLIENIQRVPSFRDVASTGFLKRQLFEWITDTHKRQVPETASSRLLTTAAEAVVQVEIWLPIYELFIESDLTLGQVTFKRLSLELLAHWENQAPASNNQSSEDVEALRSYWQRMRSDYGGRAAAVVTVAAEPLRAEELAVEFAEKAISGLRLFHPANHAPEMIAFCVLKGQEHMASRHVLLVSGGRITGASKGFIRRGIDPRWQISNESVSEFRKLGLAFLHAALASTVRTEFQTTALDSLFLYTRAATRAELTDRLVYVFAALEGLLLRSQSEPIAISIGDRLGFALEQSAEKRQEIVKIVRDAYELRSRVVHHRAQVSDVEALRKFFQCAWRFFVLVVLPALPRFKAKGEFLAEIDRVKYS